jgi:hypothetical protein
MELSEYIVNFEKRSMMKSQVLVDFVAEWMELSSAAEGEVPETPWLVYCDGAWGQQVLEQPPHSFHLRESSCATQQGYSPTAKPISAPKT